MSETNKLVFHGLDREGDIEVRQRNAPHWFQVGAAIFVTFRTIDSLPREVILRMQAELEHWLTIKKFPIELAASTVHRKAPNHQQLLETLKAQDRKEFRRMADRLFHMSLDDCHGECLLKSPELAKVVANAILHDNDDKFDLECFVMMPNHVHAIVQFRNGYDLSIVGQSWMRYSARLMHRALVQQGAFWQPEPFDHIIRSPEQFLYLQKYIAENPTKANLSRNEYVYWARE